MFRGTAAPWNSHENPVLATEIQAGNLAVFPSQNPEDQSRYGRIAII
ncbi:MAG: hypothetical protein J1E01_05080 [Acetatifactor sp.]|nr:hypothetical protein [Acetatifactor sp.]